MRLTPVAAAAPRAARPGAGIPCASRLDRRRRIVDVVEEAVRWRARSSSERQAGTTSTKRNSAARSSSSSEANSIARGRRARQRSSRTLRESGREGPADGLDCGSSCSASTTATIPPAGRANTRRPARSLRDLRDAHRRRGRRADGRRPALVTELRGAATTCWPTARSPRASGRTGRGRARPPPAPSPRGGRSGRRLLLDRHGGVDRREQDRGHPRRALCRRADRRGCAALERRQRARALAAPRRARLSSGRSSTLGSRANPSDEAGGSRERRAPRATSKRAEPRPAVAASLRVPEGTAARFSATGFRHGGSPT